MWWMQIVAAIVSTAVVSYLLGSVDFAILVTKLMTGKDIRDYGSGNAGMTNVLRVVGVGAAVLTTVGDLGKGIGAALLGRYIFSLVPMEVLSQSGLYTFLDGGMYVGIVFAMLGHMFPIYFQFRGGKGILVCAGAILIMDWRVFVTIVGIFLITVLITRYVSLGSILATIGYPIFTCIYQCIDGVFAPVQILSNTLLAAAVAAVVIFMHRANIQRLLKGTENKLGQKAKGKK